MILKTSESTLNIPHSHAHIEVVHPALFDTTASHIVLQLTHVQKKLPLFKHKLGMDRVNAYNPIKRHCTAWYE